MYLHVYLVLILYPFKKSGIFKNGLIKKTLYTCTYKKNVPLFLVAELCRYLWSVNKRKLLRPILMQLHVQQCTCSIYTLYIPAVCPQVFSSGGTCTLLPSFLGVHPNFWGCNVPSNSSFGGTKKMNCIFSTQGRAPCCFCKY